MTHKLSKLTFQALQRLHLLNNFVEFIKTASCTKRPTHSYWYQSQRYESKLFDGDDRLTSDDDDKKKHEKPPQVFLFSSAEITPFVITFQTDNIIDEQQSWRVVGEENGDIILLAPGEAEPGEKSWEAAFLFGKALSTRWQVAKRRRNKEWRY